jgi:amino acid efflux transporter
VSGGELKRSITWQQGTAMAIGSVLGSGILILPAVTAEEAGPASIISWALMSILAIPLALTLGRLATKNPNAGGIVAYARQAFGPDVGRVTGWLFLGTVPIGVPIISLVGANYVGSVFHFSPWETTFLAAVILATSLFLNARGIDLSASVQVFILCLIAVLLISAIIAALPHAQSQAFHPFMPHGWIPIGMAAVAVFWCFVGWEMVAHLAEEFQNPHRDVFISLSLAPLLIGGLYVAIAVATVGTHAYGANVGGAPLGILVGKAFGRFGTDVTAFLALLITFCGLHMNIAGFSRMVYAQAREGDFPSVFAQLHRVYKTPVAVLSALAVVFSVVLLISGLFHPNLGDLIQWPSIIFLVLYMIAMVSALKLLPKGDIGWWMALIPFVVCLVLYPFSGWACLYPIVLASVGWVVSTRVSRRKRVVHHRDETEGTIV